MSMDLSYLSDITLVSAPKVAKTKATVVKLPENADIRVFYTGKIYPSAEFAKKADLEFRPKEVLVPGSKEEVVGNGMDIFSSIGWDMLPTPLAVPVLFAYIVPKAFSKVDLWANTKYDKAHVPASSVFTQGSNVFSRGKLLQMLTDTYNIDWNKVEYVDLVLKTDIVIPSVSGMYDIPKTSKTKDGEVFNPIRRQNIAISPLVLEHTELRKIPLTPEEAPKVIETVSAIPNMQAGIDPAQAVSNSMGVPAAMQGSAPENTAVESHEGAIDARDVAVEHAIETVEATDAIPVSDPAAVANSTAPVNPFLPKADPVTPVDTPDWAANLGAPQ